MIGKPPFQTGFGKTEKTETETETEKNRNRNRNRNRNYFGFSKPKYFGFGTETVTETEKINYFGFFGFGSDFFGFGSGKFRKNRGAHNFRQKNRKYTRPVPMKSSHRDEFIGTGLVFFRFFLRKLWAPQFSIFSPEPEPKPIFFGFGTETDK